MPLLYRQRIEQKDGKTFRVYTIHRVRLFMTLTYSSLLLMIIGIFSSQKAVEFVFIFLADFALLGILTLIGIIEGGYLTANQTMAALRKKEYRMTGRAFSIKNPLERWIEQSSF